jgi:hypothetical protein
MMKKKVLKIATILLLAAGGFISCGKEKEAPIEISFTEYSLAETFCQWINLIKDYDYVGNSKVIAINNTTELEEYVNCTAGAFPEIDFSKNTILLVYGTSPQVVSTIDTVLSKYSTIKYELNITVFMGNGMMLEDWRISILVPKIPSVATINLEVDYV